VIDFYDGPAQTVPTVTTTTVVAAVTASASAAPIASAAHLMKQQAAWGPEDLRDYILTEVVKISPSYALRRNPAAEMAICKSFCQRWGAQAPGIAKFAFETCQGWWNSSPIDFRRFSKGSDPYFAAVIVERLSQASA
jgi:hypothetical protein